MNDSIYIKLVGEYLGYPSCCIEEYIKKEGTPYWYSYKEQYLEFRGFIPCDKCIEKIKTGEITTKDLISNRQAPQSYPIYTNKEHDEFLKIIDCRS